MEVKRVLTKQEVQEEFSDLYKVRPVFKSFLRESYDVVLEEVDWKTYQPGKYISKYA
jgi:hypothetical protein